ncbi:hypothetical protein [Streptomyces sp. NPDC059957]|uniref:hypothetical protein n=1 Tax=unclassified Streptomyces TaxID=2593676 RepID=UPI003649D43C
MSPQRLGDEVRAALDAAIAPAARLALALAAVHAGPLGDLTRQARPDRDAGAASAWTVGSGEGVR